jgi:hypothetical protein
VVRFARVRLRFCTCFLCSPGPPFLALEQGGDSERMIGPRQASIPEPATDSLSINIE